MAATGLSLKREVDDLTLEQIHTFKQQGWMSDREIFEYHLRHYQIMALYWELNRTARANSTPRDGWWA